MESVSKHYMSVKKLMMCRHVCIWLICLGLCPGLCKPDGSETMQKYANESLTEASNWSQFLEEYVLRCVCVCVC